MYEPDYQKLRNSLLTLIFQGDPIPCPCEIPRKIKVFGRVESPGIGRIPLASAKEHGLWYLECKNCQGKSFPLTFKSPCAWDQLSEEYVCFNAKDNCQNQTEDIVCEACRKNSREEWCG